MKRWIVFDLEGPEFTCLNTEQEAREVAKKWLKCYRDDAARGGWFEVMDNVVGVAEIKVTTVETRRETREEYEARGEEWPWSEDEVCDYGLVDVERSPDTAR